MALGECNKNNERHITTIISYYHRGSARILECSLMGLHMVVVLLVGLHVQLGS